MRGRHPRQHVPRPGQLTFATIDIGGQDEASTDPIAQLANPSRDYTAATIFECVATTEPAPGPTYRALDIFIDHGSRHFQDLPGRPSLVRRLVAYLEQWQVAQFIADSSGVGEGVYDWLCAAFPGRVTGYAFHGSGKKASLGADFLSLVETGRFKYWAGADSPLGDAWWFWQQVKACSYQLPPGGRFERDLRWGVPAAHTTPTPRGPQLTHDDRLLSAALVAVADGLINAGLIHAGQARSAVIRPQDPLDQMTF